ncbi:hypothetical protein M153_1185000199 [Pseudoloma neurophilia]|uniref:Uncharacterized protein n=1 Tax=Pseudoloma neurophilia TaxID=146866 RepID=A0A0R0M4F9_9MICR|nr:hypothetical protein M153_1185000199 [Pseudoloma neurophilia]
MVKYRLKNYLPRIFYIFFISNLQKIGSAKHKNFYDITYSLIFKLI